MTPDSVLADLDRLEAGRSPGKWEVDNPTLDGEAWFIYDANGQPVAEVIGGYDDAISIVLAVKHLRAFVDVAVSDDKLSVHRRRCQASGGPCPGECMRGFALYASAEATRAVVLAALQRDIAKALGEA